MISCSLMFALSSYYGTQRLAVNAVGAVPITIGTVARVFALVVATKFSRYRSQ